MKRRVTIMLVVLMTMVISTWAHGMNVTSNSHLVRDYQGSIMSQVDSTGFWHNDWSYDAWGRPRNPQTHVVYNPSILNSYSSGYRGYCGHEHLPQFGLINMNARLYDPITSRFLSPDPYVQMSDNTQGFNRYSYCLNNPTKYTDPSGELFVIDDWIIGFFKGLKHKPFRSANRHATNSLKIWAGLFTLDSNKTFGGKVWELVSRFTWQRFQSHYGLLYAHANNLLGNVTNVRHIYGATVLQQKTNWLMSDDSGVTIGNYITGGDNIAPDENNQLFQHEYGHYLQSQSMGLFYIPFVGIPSLIVAQNDDMGKHKYKNFERDANYRAFVYFNKYIADFYATKTEYQYNRSLKINKGWHFKENPLLPDNGYIRYVDYKDDSDLEKANQSISGFYRFFHF